MYESTDPLKTHWVIKNGVPHRLDGFSVCLEHGGCGWRREGPTGWSVIMPLFDGLHTIELEAGMGDSPLVAIAEVDRRWPMVTPRTQFLIEHYHLEGARNFGAR